MATYNPPIENLPIFDPIVFLSGDEALTTNEGDKRYLRFPNAQGEENLLAINVNGIATFNSTSTFNDDISCNGIAEFNNTATFDASANFNGASTFNSTAEFNNTATFDASANFNSTSTFNSDVNVINEIFLRDATNPTTNYTQFQTQANGRLNINTFGNGTPTNPIQAFSINNNNWLAFNSDSGLANITATDLQFSSTNAPTCNASSTILTSDSSNKIPSTAWVKSVLPVVPTSQSTLAYFRTGLVAGNQAPLATPLVISVNTGSQTGSGITMCPLVFRITCSYTNGTTSANQQDSGSVSTFCNTCSCIFNYFVYCSQPVVSGTNANYFTNGIGNATSNTAYYTPSVYGNTYGRPFWTTALSNEANVATIFPFTFTGTPFLNGVKTIVFNPPAVGYPATSSFYWEWTIEVLNKSNFAGMITSTGFNVNLNC